MRATARRITRQSSGRACRAPRPDPGDHRAPDGANRPGDRRPTPTGKIVVDLLRGRMPATLGGGMNVVPVEDVAAAHVLTLERGRPGERYIAGGMNLTLAELWRLIARAAGRPERTYRLPYAIAVAAAGVDAAEFGSPVGCPRFRSKGSGWAGSRCTRRAPRPGGAWLRTLERVRRGRTGGALVSRERVCRLTREWWPSARWAWRPGASGAGPPRPSRGGWYRRPTAGGAARNRDQRRALRRPPAGPGAGDRRHPSEVVDERGVTHACDPGVVAALTKAARYLRYPVAGGSMISTSAMVTGSGRETWASRGYVAVDMESAAVAESASRFGVLRVILDTPTHELSEAWAVPASRDPPAVALG